MIITDRYGFEWALGDCSDISLARVLLEEDDNTYYIGFSFKDDSEYYKIPFSTKEEAEAVLRQIDERMEHPLVDYTADEEAKKLYQKAKEHEERARQLNESAKRYYQNVMGSDEEFKKFLACKPILGGLAPETE